MKLAPLKNQRVLLVPLQQRLWRPKLQRTRQLRRRLKPRGKKLKGLLLNKPLHSLKRKDSQQKKLMLREEKLKESLLRKPPQRLLLWQLQQQKLRRKKRKSSFVKKMAKYLSCRPRSPK